MSLHLLWADPSRDAIFESCRQALATGDALVFCGHAVRALEPGAPAAAARLAMRASGIGLYALTSDCRELGIPIPAHVRATTPAGLVALACAHERSLSWF